jgi:Ca2+/Na+ antiporter
MSFISPSKFPKAKTILKLIAIISLVVEVILWTSQEILNIAFTAKGIPAYQEKLILTILVIGFNLLCFCVVLVFLCLNNINLLLLSGILYFVLGLVAFLYVVIKSQSSAASDPRPQAYFKYHIDKVIEAFYYLSGIALLIGSVALLVYVCILQTERNIRIQEEKLKMQKRFEQGDTEEGDIYSKPLLKEEDDNNL